MRTKLLTVALVAIMGVGASKHLSGEKMCPLGKMIFSGKSTNEVKPVAATNEVKKTKDAEKLAIVKETK